ncbi:MAG: immunity protein 39 [Sphingomonas sp.]|uniref:Imm39 family immunity protein n=1 Tax=Sphingomonas sp. TaxID=28214 RepID=UPI001AD50979|nr:Imm39 family immunity protein [Sphingomonas sp.]MBN8809383.1 immunity protein 39 [Sphingomonas sp.]
MAHNRKLVIGGVAMTTARIPAKKNGSAANRARDEIEREMIESGYLNGAPFKWVGLLIRYGLVDENTPHYEKINVKHGDLPIAIEVDTRHFLDATEEEMTTVYRRATLIALLHAGEKYNLNVGRIKELLGEV